MKILLTGGARYPTTHTVIDQQAGRFTEELCINTLSWRLPNPQGCMS